MKEDCANTPGLDVRLLPSQDPDILSAHVAWKGQECRVELAFWRTSPLGPRHLLSVDVPPVPGDWLGRAPQTLVLCEPARPGDAERFVCMAFTVLLRRSCESAHARLPFAAVLGAARAIECRLGIDPGSTVCRA